EACLVSIECDEGGLPFGGGNGISAPHLICSSVHLQNVGAALNAHFVLARSLDLSSVDDFEPLGTTATPFRGEFDGAGRALVGLVINGSENNVGLFRQIGASDNESEVSVFNLKLVDFHVSGGNQVGMLAGRVQGSDAQQVRLDGVAVVGGNVSGENAIGGLVGRAEESSITESHATSAVSCDNVYVGGLVGFAEESSISESYATGNVAGDSTDIGGLVGFAYRSSIAESYATGDVTGDYTEIGGLVGRAQESSITESYALGLVSWGGGASNNSVGALVGFLDSW